jgi:nicotinamide N-methyltransferase/methyltransferase
MTEPDHTTVAKNVDAKSYLNERYREGCGAFKVNISYVGRYHDLFKKHCQECSSKAKLKILEIGSGATINSAITLAPFSSNIVLSAYSESEAREVQLWRERSPEAFNWRPFISAILRKYEGIVDEASESVERREEEIRSSISNVVPCDLKKAEVVDPQYVPEGGFDVVVSMGVLTAAASSIEEFNSMIANISSLIKPGGFLMCNFTMGATAYYTQAKSNEATDYSVVAVTSSDVEKAYSRAGLTVRECMVQALDQSYREVGVSNAQGYIVCVGVKS